MPRIYFILLLLNSCLLSAQFKLEQGDILFQDIDCGPLCNAIEQVTQGINGARFSHVGVVINTDTGIVVLEAISRGVVYTPVEAFLARSIDSNGNPKVLAGRLKKEYKKYVPGAIEHMSQYLGMPYDTVFDLANEAYYCSELIFYGFSKASTDSAFFQLYPMTFKAPGENEFFPAWKSYFDEMQVEIPENSLGLNPGSISKSDKINIVYVYGYPDGYKHK